MIGEDKNSEGAKAGIRDGDVITGWAQADSAGRIVSPLDLLWVEGEHAPRGPVTLSGARGSVHRQWILNAPAWRIDPGPSGTEAQVIKARMDEFAERKQFDRLAEFCRSACSGISEPYPARYWLFFDAGNLLGRSDHWSAADEFYARAIDQTRRLATSLTGQIYEAWGDLYKSHGDWAIAGEHYSSALSENRGGINPDSIAVAYDLQNLALIQFRLGHLPQA